MITIGFRVAMIVVGVFCAIPHWVDANDRRLNLGPRSAQIAMFIELAWACFWTTIVAIGIVGWRA